MGCDSFLVIVNNGTKSQRDKIFSQSVIPFLLLGFAYVFIGYKIYLDGNILNSFDLYLGYENLYKIYSEESFLIIFWLHFLSISLFVGSWIARDGQRYMVPKILTAICLLATYFSGPVGILIYWFIRVFYSKKLILMSKTIEFYFDFISPYSFISFKKIKEIVKKKNTSFKLKPILLGGLHNLHNIKAPAFIPAKAKFMIRDCKMIAEKK